MQAALASGYPFTESFPKVMRQEDPYRGAMLAASSMLPVREGITSVIPELHYSQTPLPLNLLPLHTTPSLPAKKLSRTWNSPSSKHTLHDENFTTLVAQ